MGKFDHLKGQRITKDATAEYTMHQIDVGGESPTLLVSPATEANKGYFNSLLKRSNRTARRAAAGKIDVGMIQENRNEDRALYPQHVVRGWKNMIDAEGNEVPFSKEDCEDFLGAIDDWIFDDLRNFCGNPQNFVRDSIDPDDLEETAGN